MTTYSIRGFRFSIGKEGSKMQRDHGFGEKMSPLSYNRTLDFALSVEFFYFTKA